MNGEANGQQELLERAIDELRSMPVPTPPPSEAFLARLPARSEGGRRNRHFLVRRVMAIAAAAAVMLLVTGSLLLNTTANSALAQVIAATAKHRLVRCRFETSAEILMKWHADRDEEFVDAQSDEVAYFDLAAPRIRIERHGKTINDLVQQDWITIQDNQQDRILVTGSLSLLADEDDVVDERTKIDIRMAKEHMGKKARLLRIPTDENRLQPFPFLRTDKTFLKILSAMQEHPNVKAAKDSLEGRDTTKYRLDEKGTATVVWVDEETKLPVRVEQELDGPKTDIRRMKWSFSEFKWDPDVERPHDLFSLTPPAGYTFEDQTTAR